MSNIVESKAQTMGEDRQLLQEFLGGNQQAFAELVKKYKDMVFKTIYSFFTDTDEADDIAQEVFLKVYFSAASFKHKSAFSTWLYRITANECYNALKHKKVKPISLDEPVGDNGLTFKDILKDDNSSEDIVLKKELQKIVQQAIRSLPRKYALAVFLIDLNNLTYQEAAAVMDISVNKLKVWLHRGRNCLKEKLVPVYATGGLKI